LTIPIMANIHLSRILILQLGPQYGILMNPHESVTQNGADAFKSGEFSGAAGLWLNLPLGLCVSGRYVIGVSNIKDLPESNKWNSQAIQLGVGFRF
ncbi:MAG: porin family protein, partial [Chitinophagaceae bacterium]